MAQFRKIAFGLTLGLGLVAFGGAAIAQEEAIEARKAGMKVYGASMGAIKKVVDANGPASDAVAPAEAIAAQAAKELVHFVPGSDKPQGKEKGQTRAKPEIWANFAEFEKLMGNLRTAAEKTAADAKAGNIDLVKGDFGAMGGACGACHKQFRND